MKVEVICFQCSEGDGDTQKMTYMEPSGVILVNIPTGDQSQKYDCPDCGQGVIIVVSRSDKPPEPEQNPEGVYN